MADNFDKLSRRVFGHNRDLASVISPPSTATELVRQFERDRIDATSSTASAFDLATRGGIVASAAAEMDVSKMIREAIGVDTYKSVSASLAEFSSPARSVLGEIGRTQREIDRNFGKLFSGYRDPAIETARSVSEAYDKLFKTPSFAETSTLAAQAIVGTSLTDSAMRGVLGKIENPWAKIGSELTSASSIASLASLGTGARSIDPFADNVTRMFRRELGDWRNAVEAASNPSLVDPTLRMGFYRVCGVNEALTDFPADVVDEVFEFVEEDDSSAPSNEAELRSARAFAALSRLERALRTFIETSLQAEFGRNWLGQIPQQRRQAWEQARQSDIDRGREPRPRLIDYADFTDYVLILQREDNWQRSFRTAFRRIEDVRESLARLMPVRNTTMHSVFVTTEDELLLTFESKRLLTAITRANSNA